MSALEKYSSYKNSGTEWLGEIPEHWILTRLGTKFFERKEKVSDKDFEPLSVTKKGIVPQLDSAAKTNDGDNRKLVKEGDFVINSRSDRKGSSGVSPLDGSVSLINIVLEPHDFNASFCNHFLKSNGFIEEFYRNGHGIVADLWTTRYWDMKSIVISVPPKEEQIKIANFLDIKTTQINEVIKQKEELIRLLKERRQVLIHKAVTQGLDSTVKMKDSDVEWLDEVPEHWGLKRLKYIFKIRKRIAGKLGFDVLSITQQGIKVKDITSGEGQLSMDYSKYQLVYKDEFAMNHMDLLTGYVDISNYNGVISPDYRVFTLEHENCNKEYFLNLLQMGYKNKIFYAYGQGVSMLGRWRFPSDNFYNFVMPIPPKDEQENIIKFISENTNKIDNTIKFQQKQIEKIKEYKATMIDSAVTGKIKIT